MNGSRLVALAALLALAFAAAALLVMGLAAPATAQSVEAGFRLGLTRSSFGTDRVDERDALSFPAAAAVLAVRITPLVAIQPEVLFLMKGATQNATFIGVAGPDTIRSRYSNRLGFLYVEVPVLARVFLPVRGHFRPYVAAGPYMGWMGHCFGYLKEAAGAASVQATNDTVSVGSACLHDHLRRLDVGATIAAGVRLPLGHGRAAVADARYDFGVRSVVTDAATAVPNRTLSISLGITFPLAGGSAGP